jgi:hypothetical protein
MTGGGPAFPTRARTELRPVHGNAGGNYEAAVPANDGMTLRDYFAAKVAAGDAASAEWSTDIEAEKITARAELYYRIADAMLQARDK